MYFMELKYVGGDFGAHIFMYKVIDSVARLAETPRDLHTSAYCDLYNMDPRICVVNPRSVR